MRAEDFTRAGLSVPTLSDFFAFVDERQRIYWRKEVDQQPPPWTADPILQRYKFTNVYRETDRATRYILGEMRRDTPAEVRLFQAVAFRLLNRPETFDMIGGGVAVPYRGRGSSPRYCRKFKRYYWRRFRRSLRIAASRSISPLFSDAYAACAFGKDRQPDGSYRPLKRLDCYIRALDRLHADLETVAPEVLQAATLQDAWRAVCRRVYAAGSFIAYEIVNDLMYGPLVHFSENDFFIIGPGARDALALVAGSATSEAERRSQLRSISPINSLIRGPWNAIGWYTPNGRSPSCAEVESCLCEWRKYLCLRLGRGRHRIYRGGKGDYGFSSRG